MVLAILRALSSAVRRDFAGIGALRTNNFFLFVCLLIWGALVSGVRPVSAYPFLALLAVLLFFPVASDPLEKIPAVRLRLWPLSGPSIVALRLVSFALNPIVWLTAGMLIWTRGSVALPAGALLAAAVIRERVPRVTGGFAIGRIVPRFPAAMGAVASAYLRAMLGALDTWLALVIAICGTAWRLTSPTADPAAWLVLSVLIGIALSTQAQSGAGLGATRWRLLPWSAWRIVLGRDLAYLAVQFVLTSALNPAAGLAFGMTALSVGRYPALHSRLQPERWRFAGGRVLFGVLQMIAGIALAWAGPAGLPAATVLWAASVAWGGSVLAKRFHGSDAEAAPRE